MGNDSQFRITFRDRWQWASERNEWWSNVRKDLIYPVAVGVVTWAAFLIDGRLDAATEQVIAITVAVAFGFVLLPVIEQGWGLLLAGGVLRDAEISRIGQRIDSLFDESEADDARFSEVIWTSVAEGQGLMQDLKDLEDRDDIQMRREILNWAKETKNAISLYGNSQERYFLSSDDTERLYSLTSGRGSPSDFLQTQLNRLHKLEQFEHPS